MTPNGFFDDSGRYRLTDVGVVRLPLQNFRLAAGTPLAAFADGASPTPGISVDAKASGLRWNNHATPAAVITEVLAPHDRRPGTPVAVKVLASKSGATLADATTFTIAAFFETLGALNDADDGASGVSNAVVGNAVAKTVQLCARTIAGADVPEAPSAVTLSVKPTDGTLGTDDITVHAIWLEYERIATP